MEIYDKRKKDTLRYGLQKKNKKYMTAVNSLACSLRMLRRKIAWSCSSSQEKKNYIIIQKVCYLKIWGVRNAHPVVCFI